MAGDEAAGRRRSVLPTAAARRALDGASSLWIEAQVGGGAGGGADSLEGKVANDGGITYSFISRFPYLKDLLSDQGNNLPHPSDPFPYSRRAARHTGTGWTGMDREQGTWGERGAGGAGEPGAGDGVLYRHRRLQWHGRHHGPQQGATGREARVTL